MGNTNNSGPRAGLRARDPRGLAAAKDLEMDDCIRDGRGGCYSRDGRRLLAFDDASATAYEVRLGVDYLAQRQSLRPLAETVVFTGPVDAYFDYQLGELQYRSVRFETETLNAPNYQGNAVINYTDAETPFTRIIEHKHFEFGSTEPGTKTVISREYSAEWKRGDEPYYPVNDEKNSRLYEQYKALAEAEPGVLFGGRLGEYKYYDMDKVIETALQRVRAVIA